MEYILQVKNIRKVFEEKKKISTVAVDDFSADFEKGKLHAIMGHSGSGKTTALSIMGVYGKTDFR